MSIHTRGPVKNLYNLYFFQMSFFKIINEANHLNNRHTELRLERHNNHTSHFQTEQGLIQALEVLVHILSNTREDFLIVVFHPWPLYWNIVYIDITVIQDLLCKDFLHNPHKFQN